MLLLQLSWQSLRCLCLLCISRILVFLYMFSLVMVNYETKHRDSQKARCGPGAVQCRVLVYVVCVKAF